VNGTEHEKATAKPSAKEVGVVSCSTTVQSADASSFGRCVISSASLRTHLSSGTRELAHLPAGALRSPVERQIDALLSRDSG
jgi:hypothetical protein